MYEYMYVLRAQKKLTNSNNFIDSMANKILLRLANTLYHMVSKRTGLT